MILFLFFVSGATALIYEVVWSKCLVLMFGSTVQAQTTVLAVFMVGLALGSRLFGARSAAVRHPLKAYGYLEAAIGGYGLLFLLLDGFADSLFRLVGARLLDHGALLLLLKGVLSLGLLIVPTLLMGGTLPLLAAWLQKEYADSGRWSARFYSVNSLGAVFGAGLAGFFLVRTFGIQATLQLTGLMNILIGVLAIGLSRSRDQSPLPSATDVDTATTPRPSSRVLLGACAVVALTGGVSMGMEVLASRMLSLIFGASLQAFATVLMAFILGIGLGAAVMASPRLKRLPAETITLCLLLSTAVLLGLLIWEIERWVEIYRYARSGLSRNDMGYFYHQLLTAGMSIVILGVPAGLLGATLPLWMRVVSSEAAALGNRVGWLLTCNTLGAVVGVLLTGFVLMPTIGLRASFAVEAILLSAVAVFLAARHRRWVPLAVATGVTGLLVLASATGNTGWRHVMSSGVFRERATNVNPDALKQRQQEVEIVFYEDAADATVTIEKVRGKTQAEVLGLRVNGKVDASSEGDMATQYLLAHLPLAARPDSKDVFVLGLGSGITGGALLGHPIATLTIAENCEPVVRGAAFFEPWNRGVLKDPRTQVWYEDARTVLKLSPTRYDVIISEPSNPWMVGIGSVFSHDFYELAASRLKEGGVLCQWFHVYEMNDALVGMMLRTFSQTFPFFEIWDPGVGDVILVGSQRPWRSDADLYRRLFERPAPRDDLAAIGIPSPAALWARQLASQQTSFAIVSRGPMQSDGFPLLEYDAPKAFYQGTTSHLLFKFDERTWQSDLAPTHKREALAALDAATLASVFGQYGSANLELARCLELRRPNPQPPVADPNVYVGQSIMPSIFYPPVAPKELATTEPDRPGFLHRLIDAENLIHFEPRRWEEAVTTIKTILLERSRETAAELSPTSAVHYAVLAAKVSLNHGHLEEAGRLIALGHTIIPLSFDLDYLERILLQHRQTASRTPAIELDVLR